jgi:hypothetical protein
MVTVVVLAVVFLTGGIVGVLALVCASIGREESLNSLGKKPPTRAAAATRRLVGWHDTVIMSGRTP